MKPDRPLKIILNMSLLEIMSVLEYLPTRHPLTSYLTEKRDVLMSAEKIRKTAPKRAGHEIWCLVAMHGGTDDDCTCRLNRKGD